PVTSRSRFRARRPARFLASHRVLRSATGRFWLFGVMFGRLSPLAARSTQLWLLGPAAAVALLSSACLPLLPAPTQATAANPQATAASSSGTMRIGKAVRGDLNGVLTFTAQVQTKGDVAIVPRVTATLNKLDVDLGSRVRVGDTLAELDHSDLDQQVLAAQAAQASAEAKLAALKAGPKPEVLAAAQANDNADKARTPTGTQAAVTAAQRDLQDAQQSQLMARLSTTAFDLDQAKALLEVADAQLKLAQAPASAEETKAAETSVEEAFSQAELARA